MELTATSRSGGDVFPNAEEKQNNDLDPAVRQRVTAGKALHLHELQDEKKLGERVAELALGFGDSDRAVQVFVRNVYVVLYVRVMTTYDAEIPLHCTLIYK